MNILLLALIAAGTAYIKEGEVFELLGDDYKNFMSEYNNTLRAVLLYFPSFIKEAKASSEFFHAGKSLTNYPIKLAKIDISSRKNEEIKEKFKDKLVPYIFYCLAHTEICRDYKENIQSSAIVSSLRNKYYFLHNFSEIDEFDSFITKNSPFDGVIIGSFDQFNGEKYDAFLEYSKNHMDLFKFALVKNDVEWSYKFNITSDSIVIAKGKNLHNSLLPSISSLSAFQTPEEIEKFVNTTFHPYLTYVNSSTYDNIYDDHIPFGFFFVNFNKHYEKIPEFTESFLIASEKYAYQKPDEKKFQWAIADTAHYSEYIRNLGLNDQEMFLLLKFKKDLYVVSSQKLMQEDGKIDIKNIQEFYEDYGKNKYPKYYKSEPLPDLAYEKGVKIAVGSNIISLLKKKKTVLVLFAYNSSAKINEFLSVVEEAAAHFKKNREVEFIKIDFLNNYIPHEYVPDNDFTLFTTYYPLKFPNHIGKPITLEKIISEVDYLINLHKSDL